MSELAGNGCQIIVPFDERKPLKEIEKSILKKYRKYTWSKFIKAILCLISSRILSVTFSVYNSFSFS